MSRAVRIAAVTAGLMATGFVVGTAAAAVPFLVVEAMRAAAGHSASVLWVLLVGAVTGGFLGMLLGPTVAWEDLSHVPLGRAIGHCFLGTALGGCAGVILLFGGIFFPDVEGLFMLLPPLGALSGFYWAVSRLARTPQRLGDTGLTSDGTPSNVRCN